MCERVVCVSMSKSGMFERVSKRIVCLCERECCLCLCAWVREIESVCACVCMYMCLYVCVCEWEREIESVCACVCMYMCLYVCARVCVWERERESCLFKAWPVLSVESELVTFTCFHQGNGRENRSENLEKWIQLANSIATLSLICL